MRAATVTAVLLLTACGAAVTPTGADSGLAIDAGGSWAPDGGSRGDGGTDGGVMTTLVVRYAGARAVAVRGSVAPLSWEHGMPMQRASDDTWRLEVPATTDFEWKPLLDDAVWSKGPNWRAGAGATVEVQPRFYRDVGEWSVRWPGFSSALLGNARDVYVYLPPTYLENAAARMPVIYMHDGQNLFDPAAAFGGVTWEVAATLDAAANDGRFPEAIVVGVANAGVQRIDEYTPTAVEGYGGGDGDRYLRMLVEELKPRVDAELRTRPGREDTALVGSSLGGLITAWAGVTRAETFGRVGVMSPSTWWDGRVLLSEVAKTGAVRPLRVYVDCGDSGPENDGVTDTRALADAYRAVGYVDGIDFTFVVAAGATHTESAWAARLPGALEALLGPGR